MIHCLKCFIIPLKILCHLCLMGVNCSVFLPWSLFLSISIHTRSGSVQVPLCPIVTTTRALKLISLPNTCPSVFYIVRTILLKMTPVSSLLKTFNSLKIHSAQPKPEIPYTIWPLATPPYYFSPFAYCSTQGGLLARPSTHQEQSYLRHMFRMCLPLSTTLFLTCVYDLFSLYFQVSMNLCPYSGILLGPTK